MPRRSTDEAAKPFEVKVGLGFTSFGGMYYLGDPSMVPPNRFRKLINVRLGDKDVVSRPGLNAQWDSGTGDPVVEMIEKFNGPGSGRLFWGPYGIDPFADGNLAGVRWCHTDGELWTRSYYYSALDLDFTAPLTNDGIYDPAVADPILPGSLYIPYSQKGEYALMTPAESVQYATTNPPAALCPVSHAPWDAEHIIEIGGPPVPALTLLPSYRHRRAYTATRVYGRDDQSFTHAHAREVVLTFGGADYYGLFANEDQWGPCLDAVVHFNGRWLAAGHIVPVLLNPGALQNVPPPSGVYGGQQVFEVVFDAGKAEPPANLVYLVNNPDTLATPPAVYHPKALDNFFGGSLTEIFRMPGAIYSRIPTRAAGGMDGKTIRSMCVRAIRADHPITAAEATIDKLYLGTHGGYPVIAASTRVRDANHTEFIPPIHTLNNGEVYSFDGTTVKLETSGLGPGVVVCTLPDGSVLACGRTAAKLFDAWDNTWKAVAYNPVPATLPRFYDAAAGYPKPVAVPGFADAAWRATGFIWTDRVIYNGTAYYVGFDSARLHENSGSTISVPPINPPVLTGLRPPTAPANEYYVSTADAWVLYAFDRATMSMVKVRGGENIYAQLQAAYFPGGAPDAFTMVQPAFSVAGGVTMGAFSAHPPTLAVFHEQLLYSWGFDGVKAGAAGAGNSMIDPMNLMGIGLYNGAAFDDDAVLTFQGLYQNVGVGYQQTYERLVTDMLSTSRGIYIVTLHGGPFWGGGPAPPPPINDHRLSLWDGGALTIIWEPSVGAVHLPLPLITQGGRLFIGPT